MSYDETPLQVRSRNYDKMKVPDAKPATSKLLQKELTLAILTRPLVAGNAELVKPKFDLALLHLPCPVHLMQRGTGEVTKLCLDEDLDVPFLNEVMAINDSVFAADVTAADRAAPNNRAEDGMWVDRGLPRLRFPCYAHTTSSSVGRALGCCSADISGQIAMSLCMRDAGATAEFRRCIAQALLINAEILDVPAYAPDHDQNVYLDVLLKSCLPGTGAGAMRARKLKQLLTSDVREQRIQLRVLGGQLNLHSWAEAVAENLLPTMIALFPRHRWLNSLESVAAYSLLANIHNVLPLAGSLWLGEVRSKLTRHMTLKVTFEQPLQWELSDSDEDGAKDSGVGGAIPVVGAAAQAAQSTDPSSSWIAFNKQQKAKARSWIASDPRDRQIVVLVSLELGVAVLRQVEYIASDRWQMGAWARAARGEYDARVLVALSGSFRHTTTRVLAKLELPDTWKCLREQGQKAGVASRAFSLVYTQACALEQLMLLPMSLSPFIVFVLITDPSVEQARILLGTPECLRCEFMQAFLKTFSDETALLSPRCRAILIALAALARFDICRIECRHNVLRKFAQLANTGWSPELEELSAKFMCSRGSKLQHCFSTDKGTPPWKRQKKVPGPRIRMYQKRLFVRKNGMKPKPSYQRVGGGGAQRAFFARELKGKLVGVGPKDKQTRRAIFKSVSEKFKQLVPGSWDHESNQAIGRAGTVSAQETGAAFAGRPWPMGMKRSHDGNVKTGVGSIGGAHQEEALALQLGNLTTKMRANLADFESLPREALQHLNEQCEQDVRDTVEASERKLQCCEDPLWKGLTHKQGVADVSGSPQAEMFDMSVHPVMPPAADIVQKVLEMTSSNTMKMLMCRPGCLRRGFVVTPSVSMNSVARFPICQLAKSHWLLLLYASVWVCACVEKP